MPTSPRAQLRVADHDRQDAATRLLAAVEAGRLDLLEYDDRLARVYRAVTYADLDALFADLPPEQRAPRPAAPVSPAGVVSRLPGLLAQLPRPLAGLWATWLSVVSVNLCVWLLVSIGNGWPDYFWPMWLAVPGAVLFAVSVAARSVRGVDPGDGAPRE